MLPLVFLDVDGTLIGLARRPTDAVWAAVDDALSRGQHLALCTARWAAGPTWDWAQRLDPAGWHVFHAGAALVHGGTGEAITAPLAPEVITHCAALAARNRWVLEHYTVHDYAVDSDAPLAVEHATLLGVPHRRRDPAVLDGEQVRVQFVVAADEVAAVVAEVGEGPSVSIATSPVMAGAAFVSVAAPGVSKATALHDIAELVGVSLADVMMVGDGHNDVEAMELVGHGVAMANADPACARVARHHVASVEDDGVVEALRLAADLRPDR